MATNLKPLAVALGLLAAGGVATAAQAETKVGRIVVGQAQQAQPWYAVAQSGSSPAKPATISLADLERVAQNQGIQVKEMKVRDLLLKVEGYDAQGRKVELYLDRRNGEVLSRQFDD